METRSRSKTPPRNVMDNNIDELSSKESVNDSMDEPQPGPSGEGGDGGGRPPKRSSQCPVDSAPSKVPRQEILLPPLPKSLLGLWARKHPRAAAHYTQLQVKQNLTPEDLDFWIKQHSDAYARYTKFLALDVSSDEEEGELQDDTVALLVDPSQDHFHEETNDHDKTNGANRQRVVASSGSERSGQNVPPIDKRQMNFDRIHQELSDTNTANLVGSVTDKQGELNKWFNNVHGVTANDTVQKVSIQLPSGSVVLPTDDIEVEKPGTSLLDLGLTEHLSEDLISQIQSGKFVELHKLLPVESADLHDEKKVVTFDEDEGSVVVKPKDMRKKITTFSQWSKAWSIYHMVYIDKYPEMSRNLIKYAENVRTAAYVHSKNSDGWLLYDRHFRAKMAKDTTGTLRWQDFDYELLHSKVLIPAIKKQINQLTPGQNQSKNPKAKRAKPKKPFESTNAQQAKKTCKFFNLASGCRFGNGCRFSHICLECNSKAHGKSSCTKSAAKSSTPSEK